MNHPQPPKGGCNRSGFTGGVTLSLSKGAARGKPPPQCFDKLSMTNALKRAGGVMLSETKHLLRFFATLRMTKRRARNDVTNNE